MKGIGKPCTGKLFARFDEGGLALPALYSTLLVPMHSLSFAFQCMVKDRLTE